MWLTTGAYRVSKTNIIHFLSETECWNVCSVKIVTSNNWESISRNNKCGEVSVYVLKVNVCAATILLFASERNLVFVELLSKWVSEMYLFSYLSCRLNES